MSLRSVSSHPRSVVPVPTFRSVTGPRQCTVELKTVHDFAMRSFWCIDRPNGSLTQPDAHSVLSGMRRTLQVKQAVCSSVFDGTFFCTRLGLGNLENSSLHMRKQDRHCSTELLSIGLCRFAKMCRTAVCQQPGGDVPP